MTVSRSHQTWDAQSYQHHTPFVAKLGEGVVTLLDPQPGERILDLGCGDGALTRVLLDAGATVVGLDASESFVDSARAAGIDAHVGDVQQLAFTEEFDAVFTNAVLHWVPDHPAMARGVYASLVPGGRFVGEFGGFGNVAAISTALRLAAVHYGADAADAAPYNNPTEHEFSAVLETAGFEVEQAVTFARPTLLPTGMRGWLEVMRGTYLDSFGDQRDLALNAILAALEPSMTNASGEWFADYVRLRFIARKPQ